LSAALPNRSPAPGPKWRQLLDMGEQLMRLQSSGDSLPIDQLAAAQKELIRETAETLFQAQADLWLAYGRGTSRTKERKSKEGKSFRLSAQPDIPLSDLMQMALRTQAVCCIINPEGQQFSLLADLDPAQEPAAVALPLLAQDQESQPTAAQGVLQVSRPDGPGFNPQEIDLLQGLASQATIALRASRGMLAERRRLEQLAAIHEVSNAITSILDKAQLLNEVVDLIYNRFGYPFVQLFSVHPGRRKVFYEAGSGTLSQRLLADRYSFDLDDPEGLIPWVARSGEIALANDVSTDPRYRPASLPPDETRAELTVPLIFGGKVLGVLDIQSDQADAFGEEDRFLFEMLADNIAIALRNAALYRSEAWRRQVADSLREVAGLLSADDELEQVLDSILIELDRNLPLELAAFWLLDGDVDADDENSTSFLNLAAMHGDCIAELDLESGMRPRDVLELNPSELLETNPEMTCTWLGEALAAVHPVTRSPESSYEPMGAALDYPNNYSAIAAPLRVGDRTLGILTLAHPDSGRYGRESRGITAAFASYAAVAIQNTRLYESAHEQAWVSTVLLQVAEATQSQTDLDELLNTVIRITPTLSGVKACLLYIFDEDGVYRPAAASGLDENRVKAFKERRFWPEDVPALELLLDDKRPVVLGTQGDDRLLSSILYPDSPENDISFLAELLVLVPLLAHGEVVGTFLVDYSVDLFSANGAQSLDVFIDERLSIIQGIAHQTAMAVENMRLLKSQKEEAYISVALLQVAQAVVSSNELDEILGSVVRITPILAGVNRSAIYLWDESQELFHLSQAYGIPRGDQTPQYTPAEFPFMYAVYLQDSLLACPVPDSQNASEDFPFLWLDTPVPDLDEVDSYLENEVRLLLAFPLSVKGRVLGVLLVEEPEGALEDGLSASANLRLRAKRMEIITGISQQAALAIQNDAFQRETVERERLEREMQLAREIQQAFLPHELPDLPAWDLQVRWKTAREVGGDFYDYFELPDGRLGLVIADVADKGMPAALFMTLVRTLVRATIQDLDSPTDVLGRVNKIIVPEAPQGMFVTLTYAVLCLESGELQYANAGHNPPLVLRCKTRTMERLLKGGMAMGVMADSRVETRSITLDPGDYLIMYTDGVTEAFSPGGDIYGEKRLYQTLEHAARWALDEKDQGNVSALEIVDAIDESVNEFIGDELPSDDLTLMVVKRLGG